MRRFQAGRLKGLQTRSDCIYSAFGAIPPRHSLVATSFDFASELRNALEKEVTAQDSAENHDDIEVSLDPLPSLDTFSPFGSPLSSLTCTPTTSPSTSRPNSPAPSNLSPESLPVVRATHFITRSHPANIKRVHLDRDTPGADSIIATPTRPRKRKQERGKKAKKKRIAAKKADARTNGIQFNDAFTYRMRRAASAKFQDALVIACEIDAIDLPHSSSTYIGYRQPADEEPVTLDILKKAGYRLVEWDGCAPILIADKNGRIIVMLLGRPMGDETWVPSMEELQAAIRKTGDSLRFGLSHLLPAPSAGPKENRRGDYKTVAVGLSYGGGQKPGNLKHTKYNQDVLDGLLTDVNLKRLVGFGNAGFAFYAPQIYKHYRDELGKLYRHDSRLRRLFRGSLYPAISFNLGPSVVTVEHEDSSNMAAGLCLVYSGGSYDPKQGGHLYLKQLRLVVEFPPYSAIAIPSAIIRHGNIPIQPGETRTSITQYAAGGLFRWIDYGFRTWPDLQEQAPQLAQTILADREKKWRRAVRRFSKVSELHKDRMRVFYRDEAAA
ncbi:hypothetical protein NM688_g8163 [Phlebia brevispora]|uniref:Uncharacterized protein n=1 Tax=Phlebia brevispora TaxID=194682 RepID=A0ACC1RWY4_9APHY|nr:hypothetical protein NM688_g8163 [Phlebia brevispora]